MDAVATHQDDPGPILIDHPPPTPSEDEAVVQTNYVGIDGTDYEVIAGGHGAFPPESEYLILGHEAIGTVETAPSDASIEPGDTVVPTVRRPPPSGPNRFFEDGEPDMAPPEDCVERGISGAHGFMTEFFTSPPSDLIPIPGETAHHGVLLEPLSVIEKALDHASTARSAFNWTPTTGLVLGNGSLGLLALATLATHGYEQLYCVGRRDQPDPTIDIIESLGATYIDSRQTPVDAIADAYMAPDLIVEATGYAKHAYQAIPTLAPNGVIALLGLPEDWSFEINGGSLHRELVMYNKAIIGSVNGNHRHFTRGIDTLDALSASFLDALITGVYPISEFQKAFPELQPAESNASQGDETPIKTALKFNAL